jgi:hypothetical protein
VVRTPRPGQTPNLFLVGYASAREGALRWWVMDISSYP